MEEKRTLYFTSQGFRSQEIVIAPELDDSKSKRLPLIQNEDKLLDGNITELDEGTRARNRAFQQRLDEIWKSASEWEAKLKNEGKEAVESIMNLKDDYRVHLDNFFKSVHAEMTNIFDKLDNELLPQQSSRVDVIEKSLDVFVKSSVPDAIERQSGEVSRQLRRAYETFDIEKKKELKRETKLVDKASHHLQSTAQRFNDEGALMSSCFFTLEDDIVDHERRAARMHLLRNVQAVSALAGVQGISSLESTVRQEEDVEVLDTVIETQGLLQQTVLMHFGTKADDLDVNIDEQEATYPVMDRLNRRMEKINSKQQFLPPQAQDGDQSKSRQ